MPYSYCVYMVGDDRSNRRHPACKAGALPAELIALNGDPWGNRTPVNGGECGTVARLH